MISVLRMELPIRTVSTLNQREHYMVRARRAAAQKQAVLFALRPFGIPHPPLFVTLTRIGPKRLDDDNLRGAFKSVRDGIAAWLAIDDGDPRVMWDYAQRVDSSIAKLRFFTQSGAMKTAANIRMQLEMRQP